MAKRKAIPQRQLCVLTFVYQYWDKKGYCPTRQEIADGLNVASTNGINGHLTRLEERGLIAKDVGISRGMSITAEGKKAVQKQHNPPQYI